MKQPKNGYLVRSNINRSLILCTNGEFYFEDYIGPGTTRCARIYKTVNGAKKVRDGAVLVEIYRNGCTGEFV